MRDLDPGRGAAPAVPADAVADLPADGFTQQRGHPGAAARAATRRGSATTIRPGRMPASASGTSVVLPVPGGATSTAGPAGRQGVRQRGQRRADRQVVPRRPGRWQHGDQSLLRFALLSR